MDTDSDSLNPSNDEMLARRAQGGCGRSFETLVLRHEADVLRFLSARLASDAEAEDLVQETFVKVFRGLGSYDPARPFRAWLFTIARRVWIDRYRSRSRKVAVAAGSDSDRQDPASVLARRDEVVGLWRRAAALLTEAQWTCLWMRHQAGMNVDEIAAATGRSAILVRVTLHRARLRLASGIVAAERPELMRGLVPPTGRMAAVATVTESTRE